MWHMSWLWPTTINRQTSNATYSSAILLIDTHSSRSQYVSMEADAAYQGCLPSCELHSRSIAVGRTDACDLEIAHVVIMQSRDSENAQRNLKIAQILRLHGTYIFCMSCNTVNECYCVLCTDIRNIFTLQATVDIMMHSTWVVKTAAYKRWLREVYCVKIASCVDKLRCIKVWLNDFTYCGQITEVYYESAETSNVRKQVSVSAIESIDLPAC